ncbi:hypothetical protein KC318_g18800 [Hortaea werneckii]|nr:hypothetical protein KC334_g19129 [Hortaea werneckii]KAI6908991.1 hypothetical protein KC355_g18547 [Hortaea werneckii]KAI7114667.1 hypothetical protein KC324_g19251 [Hortaea werneckii]KAI7346158.1 hypothetical protein KC354_g14369 [Hortaea werneckii]KAI7522590.1 hypothetical protein KC316_g19182 [Hortaea werneckii]
MSYERSGFPQQSRRRYHANDFVRPDDEVVEHQDLRSDSEGEMAEETDTDRDYVPNPGRQRRTGPRIGGDTDSEEE